MNNHQYLVEVLIEEMPARMVRAVSEQFKERVAAFLTDNRLSYEDIKAYATPRRFAVLVSGLADKQTDFTETLKGPIEKIAKTEDGEWSKAALGFARSKGAEVDDIYFKDLNGKSYAYVDIEHSGSKTRDILPGIADVIEAMKFPQTMRWSTEPHFEYLRPIHGIVSVFDKEVIPFTVRNITAGNATLGHRTLSSGDVTINFAGNYEEILEEAYVIADQDKRQVRIEEQIATIADDAHISVVEDPELLEEVTQIVEWPTAFLGHFDEKYLELPEAVLVTSMRDNQRYFAVRDMEGNLAPYFIALRNGDDTNIEGVKAGNEKVLVARLEDALFFVGEDREQTIDDFAAQLSGVTFHSQIGSLADKMASTTALAKALYSLWETTDTFAGELYDEFKPKIERLGAIYKFDLMTQVVDEFSSLQGVIGEIYAREAGEDEAVATAIREHYLPTQSKGEQPKTPLGILFAVADKLDTIIHFFVIGKIPSGSNDPYALRRAMIGIVQILLSEHLPLRWDTQLPKLLEDVYGMSAEDSAVLTEQVLKFVDDRLIAVLKEAVIRSDISDAVRHATVRDVVFITEAADVLQALSSEDNFKDAVEAWQRTVNLGTSQESLKDRWRVQTNAFETDSETALYDAQNALEPDASPETALSQLEDLVPQITAFFDDNMVMVDDETLRNNRLTILEKLSDAILAVADVRRINEKVAD
ncbi:MAG: glycine--tRNA ligase subunit beta [Aerococcus sp.]|nr:glycine--tRNA ligase subunit beta [Aerococcus sp.]